MKTQLFLALLLGLLATLQSNAQRHDQSGQIRVIQHPIAPLSSRPLPQTNIYSNRPVTPAAPQVQHISPPPNRYQTPPIQFPSQQNATSMQQGQGSSMTQPRWQHHGQVGNITPPGQPGQTGNITPPPGPQGQAGNITPPPGQPGQVGNITPPPGQPGQVGNTQQQWHHHGHNEGKQHQWHHHKDNHQPPYSNNDTTSVVYPYYPYGYYYNYDYSYPEIPSDYPNNYYICYEVDQTDENTYHVTCPLPVRWYSTNPTYDSYDYQTKYRPEYVCQDNNTTDYLEFPTSYDAVTWANNNCNRDLEQQDLP